MAIRILKDFQNFRAGQILDLPEHEAEALVFLGVAAEGTAEAAERSFADSASNSSPRELINRKIESLDAAARAKAAEVTEGISEDELEEIQRAHGVLCDELAAHRRALRVLETIG
ncbi:MAG: hypothetical protein ACR652_10890 [Methylocystis sp.]|uniref:hypothetical protein n=1 Tax=Methylocystis sp. TaxID=1911079 RepID=UPI003DA6A115